MTQNIISRILLVDDEPEIREIYSEALTQAGFAVVTAANGEQGVELAKKERPDLILMDIKMPILSGMDAAMKLKEDPDTRDIKIVFLTAFGDPAKDMAVAKAYGAADFIKKGIGLDELATKVRTHLLG